MQELTQGGGGGGGGGSSGPCLQVVVVHGLAEIRRVNLPVQTKGDGALDESFDLCSGEILRPLCAVEGPRQRQRYGTQSEVIELINATSHVTGGRPKLRVSRP